MNKRIASTTIILLLASLVAGLQVIEVAEANFFPGDALRIDSPISKMVYTNTTVPLNIVASVANPTPEVVSITYTLDENANVTLTNLNKTLRVPGHIDGSQFYADLVLENLAEGNHTIKAYSQDAAGTQMSRSVEFAIDTHYTSPLTVLSPQNVTYTTTEAPLTFILREDGPHDGNLTNAVYMLDGIGSAFIYENSTLTDLSIGSHTMILTVWTENGFFSETIQFSITNQTPTATPAPSKSPTQQPTNTTPPPVSGEYLDLTMLYIIIGVIGLAIIILIAAFALIYSKNKTKKQQF